MLEMVTERLFAQTLESQPILFGGQSEHRASSDGQPHDQPRDRDNLNEGSLVKDGAADMNNVI
jgi:hypothetical protein